MPIAALREPIAQAALHAMEAADERYRRDIILTAEQLAQIIVQSIDRHGLRGLIYEADGVADVVMHGKVNMLAVAADVLEAVKKD